MLPLDLTVRTSQWRLFSARREDPAFQKFSQKVWVRDRYTCQYCGFQAKDFQEVVNVNHNYQNNRLSNLITACCFCTQCNFLDIVGLNYGGGNLIYLPELPQNELNSFCHVLFCAMTNDTGYRDTAQSIYRTLKFRAQPVEEQFGENGSLPAQLVQMFIEMDLENSEKAKTVFKNLRLLPSRAKFKDQIEKWAETALSELSAD